MRYAVWFIAAFLVLGILLTIKDIGKPRKPGTPGLATAVTVVNAAFAVILMLAGMRL